MKKVSELLFLIFSLIISIDKTIAFYNTRDTLIVGFHSENYRLNLNANGGLFEDKILTIKNNHTTLPTPFRKGYQFLGFSNEPNGNIEFSANIDNVDEINNNLIYAKWNAETYKIAYNLNNGQLNNKKENYTIEETFSLPTPYRDGYSFIGWTGSNGNISQTQVNIPKGTTGNLNYFANWKVNVFSININSIIQNITYDNGLSGFNYSVWINEKLVADHVIDYSNHTVDYASIVKILVYDKDGYNLKSFKEKTYTITSDLIVSPIWYDDIPPSITSFSVTNLGLYDPIAGIKKGWNVNIFINAYDNGSGIKKYQTWLAPYGSGSGASREDGPYRELRNVLYLESSSGRTFCAYAIDNAGNESSKCETIKVE